MRCDDCGVRIDPETDRHAIVYEKFIAPDLGTERAAGELLCVDCGDVEDARLAP